MFSLSWWKLNFALRFKRNWRQYLRDINREDRCWLDGQERYLEFIKEFLVLDTEHWWSQHSKHKKAKLDEPRKNNCFAWKMTCLFTIIAERTIVPRAFRSRIYFGSPSVNVVKKVGTVTVIVHCYGWSRRRKYTIKPNPASLTVTKNVLYMSSWSFAFFTSTLSTLISKEDHVGIIFPFW